MRMQCKQEEFGKVCYFFGLKLCFMVFSITEQLSCTLQGKKQQSKKPKGLQCLPSLILEDKDMMIQGFPNLCNL